MHGVTMKLIVAIWLFTRTLINKNCIIVIILFILTLQLSAGRLILTPALHNTSKKFIPALTNAVCSAY